MPASTATCADKDHYVYVLRCPETATALYVGCTVEPKKRLAHHITMAKQFSLSKTELYRVIESMLARGLSPYMEIIGGPLKHEDAYELEKRIIERADKGGRKLLNHMHTEKARRVEYFMKHSA